MSIQPLSNNTPPAYSPATGSPPSAEAAAPRETKSPQNGSRIEETRVSNRIDEKEALRHATQKANQAIEGLRSDLKFTIDKETGSNVVKFIDVKTKEVIRQIPAQEMLLIAKRLDELRGLLIKERV